MTTTQTDLPGPAIGAEVGVPRVAPRRRRLSLPWLALGVLLVGLCMLAGVVTLASVGQRRAVLMVARPVPAGAPVAEADLAVVRVAADPRVGVIPAAGRAQVVGRPAAVPLVPGSLLSPAALGEPATLAPGEAIAGVAVKPGFAPVHLAPGTAVRMVQVSAGAQAAVAGSGRDSDDGSLGAMLVRRAVVVSVTTTEGGAGGRVVEVRIPAEAAERVAGASAAGRVALVSVREAG